MTGWKNREVVKKNGYTFTIVQHPTTHRWHLIREYVMKCDNHIFDSREDCIRFIDEWTERR